MRKATKPVRTSFILFTLNVIDDTAERAEEASKALAAKREYASRVDQIARDFEEEKKMTFEITQDMTRQYKSMQEELLGRVNNHLTFLCGIFQSIYIR